MMTNYIAHVKQLENGDWEIHPLETHLQDVAEIANNFGRHFSSSEWARLAGLWHDLGKYRPAFQKHIKKSSGYDPNASISSEYDANKNHASTGAMYAVKSMEKPFGRALAYMIAGHHAGLPDYTHAEARGRSLDEALQDKHFLQEALNEHIPNRLLTGAVPKTLLPMSSFDDIHCWIRMVFSALVDADFLDTEAFMQPDRAKARVACHHDMSTLLEHFNAYMSKLTANTRSGSVNKMRDEVLHQARNKACGVPGIYTMSVPTGGGKTLSSLAFALEHACLRDKRRVIYAIPYTSIIEQTANIFKNVFALLDDVVLEHHSNVEPEEKQEITTTRLAAENWDIPVVVTTTVQLFESLFAAKPSRCRKLHNLVNSVIVLDETQLLPPGNLNPIRHMIELLAKHYGVTFLLTTATPTPTAGFDDAFGKQLLKGIGSSEIVDHPQRYYQQLRRVEYKIPEDFYCRQSWDEIAEKIREHTTVLAIVNKRDDARALFTALNDENAFHLSALMCPIHRHRVISRIKERLNTGRAVRVISTQLVEAGVDFDFPIVFRAVSGIDSIIQAAGRCNREGKLIGRNGKPALGQVNVFVPPSESPPGLLSHAFQTAASLLKGNQDNIDTPAFIHKYFEHLHALVGEFDSNCVLPLLQKDADSLNIQFRTAAQKFQMIEEGQTYTLFVDYGEDESERKTVGKMLRILENGEIDRWLVRKLQPYSISLYNYQKPELLNSGVIRQTESGYYIISGGGVYDDILGFQVMEQGVSSGGVF